MSPFEYAAFVALILLIVAVSFWFGRRTVKPAPREFDRTEIARLVGLMRGTESDYGWGDWLIGTLSKGDPE